MRVILANIMAIYRKELLSYLTSPLSYAIAGVFWLLGGFFFMERLLGIIDAVAQFDLQGATSQPIDVPYEFLRAYLGILGSLSLFVLPMLSMGLYAEERKRGTLELLATSPLTNWAVAAGKLLAVLTFFITLVLPFLAFEAIAFSSANPPVQPGVMFLGHLGLILLAASILSLGMFLSSLTDSTILAAVFTFALILFLWIIDVVAKSIGGPVGIALGHLSLLKHYSNLMQGVFDSSSILLFASYIILGIFLTAQSIEALKFQRS